MKTSFVTNLKIKKAMGLAVLVSLLLMASPSLFSMAVWGGEQDKGQLEEVKALILKHHVDNPTPAFLAGKNVDEMLKDLSDPYTVVYSPVEFNEMVDSINQNYVGVGMIITPTEEGVTVEHCFPGSPAEKAGLRPGDLLLSVNGEAVLSGNPDEIARKVRGPEGTNVTISFRPKGSDESQTVNIIRSRIHIPNVEGAMYNDKVGYIQINTFGEDTAEEFEKLYVQQLEKGMTGLILDLRGNGGGMLTTVEQVGDTLLPEGHFYHIIEKMGKKSSYSLSGNEKPPKLAVLVDGLTASASELLAGALRERAGAVLIGDKTYGKGSVQAMFPLKGGGVLKMTVARYQTSMEKPVDRVGLSPDQPVAYSALQLIRAKQLLDVLTNQEIRYKLGDKEILVSGESLTLSDKPLNLDGRLYLPIRFLGEALGYTVDFDAESNSISLEQADQQVHIPLNGGAMLKKGQEFMELDELPIEKGRAMASVRLLGQGLGWHVDFNAENGEVIIQK